jgi:hypothetical protein
MSRYLNFVLHGSVSSTPSVQAVKAEASTAHVRPLTCTCHRHATQKVIAAQHFDAERINVPRSIGAVARLVMPNPMNGNLFIIKFPPAQVMEAGMRAWIGSFTEELLKPALMVAAKRDLTPDMDSHVPNPLARKILGPAFWGTSFLF